MFALTAITLIDQEMSQKLLTVKRVALSGSPSGFMSFCRNLLGLQGAEMHWGALEISTAFNCFAWSVTITLLWTEWLFSGSSSKAKSFWRHWRYLIVEINQDCKSASHGACNTLHPMKVMAGWLACGGNGDHGRRTMLSGGWSVSFDIARQEHFCFKATKM